MLGLTGSRIGNLGFNFHGDGTRTAPGCVTRILGTLFFSVFLGMGLLFCGLLGRQVWEDARAWTWPAVSCTIEESRVETVVEGAGEPYAFAVRYRYEHGGQAYVSDAYQHGGMHTGDYAEAARLAARYPAGAKATCYVNPGKPADAVLHRKPLWIAFAILLPLVFVAIGAVGLRYALRPAVPKSITDASSISQAALPGKPRIGAFLFFGVFFLGGVGAAIPLFILPLVHLVEARSWQSVPCTVVSSSVRSHRGEDGDTYSVDIRYDYRFAGRPHSSNRYNFAIGSSSGYESKRRIVDQYRPGRQTVCYVDPGDPTQAVLNRELTWGMALLGLFPLPFLAIGAGGMIYNVRSRRRSLTQGPPWAPKPLVAVPSRLGDGTALRAQQSPRAKLIVIIFVALFWNGLISVFLYHVIDGWQRGHGEWFLTIFMIPFVLVGLGLIIGIGYFALACFNPRIKLALEPASPHLGDSASLIWLCSGRIDRISRLHVWLEGREEATYRRGTTTTTDKEVFARIELLDTTHAMEMVSGGAALTIPRDTMHSFCRDEQQDRLGRAGAWRDPALAGREGGVRGIHPAARRASGRAAVNDLSISIRQNATTWAPGAALEGEVSWFLSSPPKAMELRLFWYNVGQRHERCQHRPDPALRLPRCPGPPAVFLYPARRPVQLLRKTDQPELGAGTACAAQGTNPAPAAGDLADGRRDRPARHPPSRREIMKARENPFAVHRVLAIRYRPQGVSWEQLLARLAELEYRAAIVGPEGSGKTTLLEDLGERLAGQGFAPKMIQLCTEQCRLPPDLTPQWFSALGRRDLILLDGADLMGRLRWRMLLRRARRAGGIVIASHRPGLLPTLLETQATPELLEQIVGELLEGSGEATPDDLPGLFGQYGGNIRDVLRALYDRWARRVPFIPAT